MKHKRALKTQQPRVKIDLKKTQNNKTEPFPCLKAARVRPQAAMPRPLAAKLLLLDLHHIEMSEDDHGCS